jgi:hypothetical protein
MRATANRAMGHLSIARMLRREVGGGQRAGYCMTSSARRSTDCGIVRPRALAVFESVTYCAVFTLGHRPLPVAPTL